MTEPLRLNIGCGQSPRQPGFLNCDLLPAPNVDVPFDLMKDWPFPDNSVAHVYASHVLEHLHDPRAFFRELWRVLQPGGAVLLRTPYGGHHTAWVDVDHVRPWFPGSFGFLQPGYGAAVRSHQHNGWTTPFCVHMCSVRVALPYCRWLRRWRALRRWLMPVVALIPDSLNELWVELSVLKTPAAIAEFHQQRAANAVPVRYVAYGSEWDGRPAEPVELVEIMEG